MNKVFLVYQFINGSFGRSFMDRNGQSISSLSVHSNDQAGTHNSVCLSEMLDRDINAATLSVLSHTETPINLD